MNRRATCLVLLPLLVCFAAASVFAQPRRQYYAGGGGKGVRIAVLEPKGIGLLADERWMLSLVQGSITGDFNKYSAMTVIDRQNLEKIFAEWEEGMSGNYSDADRVKIGNLTSAGLILSGAISKTASAFMLELSVTDVASGERRASYSPTPVSPVALENLSAIKAASAELLLQLGVELTAAALGELKRAADISQIKAQTMLSRGIEAKGRGAEVEALSYFYRAAAFDASLLEAANRSSVMAASISSGDIGADLRGAIEWRKSWLARLAETEAAFHGIIEAADPPYTLFYSTGVQMDNIDYQRETADFSFPINLSANASWFDAMNRALQAVDAVLDGLNATGKKDEWGLGGWPWRGETGANPFVTPKRYDIEVVFELVNGHGRAIGGQTARLNPVFKISRNGNGRFVAEFDENTLGVIDFYGVRAGDFDGGAPSIRVASVNGAPPQSARFAISAVPAEEWRKKAGAGAAPANEAVRGTTPASAGGRGAGERKEAARGGGGAMIAIGGTVNMNSLDTLYTSGGGQVSVAAEGYKGGARFFRYGMNLDMGFVGYDAEAVKKMRDDVDSVVGAAFFINGGFFIKLQPVDAFYVLGGANIGYYGGSDGKSIDGKVLVKARRTIPAVFPVGAGLVFGSENENGLFSGLVLDARYNITMLPNGSAGYISAGYWSFSIGRYAGTPKGKSRGAGRPRPRL